MFWTNVYLGNRDGYLADISFIERDIPWRGDSNGKIDRKEIYKIEYTRRIG